MQRCKPEIRLVVEMDTTPVRENAIASGDDTFDRQTEDMILERLEKGDVWAWAYVTVIAEFRGLTAYDDLGCCSYEDEDDFRACGYYRDMVSQATNELADMVDDLQGIEIERL